MESNTKTPRGTFYQIRLKGLVDPKWSDWFEGFTITPSGEGQTLLVGAVIDQAALHGLLLKISNLGLSIIAINSLEPDSPEVKNLAGE